MTWKVVNISDTGTASKFGANDMDKISNMFSGIDVDDVDINVDWKFRDTCLQIFNPARTFEYKFVSDAIVGDRNIILPLLTGNDTLVFNSFAATLANKTLDATCTINDTALSSNVVLETRSNDHGDFDNSFKDNRLRIWNPADTFRYTITAGAISSNRILNLPVLTGTDTIAVLGLPQSFTDTQTIFKNTSDLLKVYRDSNTVNDSWGVLFDANNATPAQVTYGRIRSTIITNTAGAEDGQLRFSVSKAGSLSECARIDETGKFNLGGPNRRIVFDETNLSAARNIKLTDFAQTLPGILVSSGAVATTNTTAAEFDILNQSIAANTLGANGALRVQLYGNIKQNQATGTTYTLKIKFGTTVMYEDVSGTIAQTANTMPFTLDFTLYNKNATNSQGLHGEWKLAANDNPTTGFGDTTDDEIQAHGPIMGADPAKDTTSAQTLQVTMTMSVSNAAVETQVNYKSIEVIRPA